MERKTWGKTESGEEVFLYTFRTGEFIFSVMTKGATIVYWGTQEWNAVLSHPSLEGYYRDGNGHRGEVVGPYANRIAGASFTLDGVTYNLDRNFHGRHTLHSGSANWGDRVWKVEGVSENTITLSLSTPDGDGGFPGSHDVLLTYMVSDGGELVITYRVRSSKKCPVAVTNHTYFVLDDRDDRELMVTIPAEKYVAVDSLDLIPLATTPDAVEGTDYDFRTPVLIGARNGGRYDNTWVLDENAVVRAEGNRALLRMRTSEKGVQMYTGGSLPEPFKGIAFESGQYPDTPNRPDFPQSYTAEDEEYISTTVYFLEMKGE